MMLWELFIKYFKSLHAVSLAGFSLWPSVPTQNVSFAQKCNFQDQAIIPASQENQPERKLYGQHRFIRCKATTSHVGCPWKLRGPVRNENGLLEAQNQPRKKQPDTPSSRWFSLAVFVYFLYTPGEVSWSTRVMNTSLLQKTSVWQRSVHTGWDVTSFVPAFQGKLYQRSFISAI